MSLNLSTDDLQAIKTIVEDAIDDANVQTAAGFAEVHEKIDELRDEIGVVRQDVSTLKQDVSILKHDVTSLKQTVERIELVQRAEVDRVDLHGQRLTLIERQLTPA